MKHRRKMIAPVVITVLLTMYCIVYFTLLMKYVPSPWRYAAGMLPIAGIAVMIAVCVQRIREIRSGEEDDLEKY